MVVFDKLWLTMKERNISQYRLIKYYGFSSGQIGRLKKNMYVSTHTIDVLCTILNCKVEDIMEFQLDKEPSDKLGIDPSVAVQPPKLPLIRGLRDENDPFEETKEDTAPAASANLR